MCTECSMRKKSKIILLVYFIVLFGYMPTARYTDKLISIITLMILCLNFAVDFLRRKQFKLDKCVCWYILVVFFGLITSLVSSNMDNFELFFTRVFPLVLVGVIYVSNCIKNENDVEEVFRLVIVAGSIAALRFCYYTPWSNYLRGQFGSMLDDVTNYNNYTTQLAVICIIAAYYAFIKREKWSWLPFSILFAVTLIGGSRKNFLIIPFIILYYSLSQGNIKRKYKTLVAFALIIGGGIMRLCIWRFFPRSKKKHWKCYQGYSLDMLQLLL